MASETVLAQLEQLLQRRPDVSGGDQGLLADFVSAYFVHKREVQLGNRSAEELLQTARAHLALTRQRPERVQVSVVPLASPRHGCDTAAMVAVPDMPFVVATVLMAVRAAGAGVDWVLHPVLRLVREQGGRLASVIGAAGQAAYGDEESLVYVEFTAPPDFDRDGLAETLENNLVDLAVVVADYQPMRGRLQQVIEQVGNAVNAPATAQCRAAQAFLHWLDNHHFTFLGYRQRAVETGSGVGDEGMIDVAGSSLGLLREDRPGIDPDGYVAPAAELDKYAQSTRVLVVAKANTRSWIHHPAPMDVVTIKHLDRDGNVIGAHRFLGLFSTEAYAASPSAIPVLDAKVQQIFDRAGFRPGSHDAKALASILETFPRDELFQSSDDELFDCVMSVLAMRESEPLRLFMRRDRYGRFYACLVYIPRDRFTSGMRRMIAHELERQLDGSIEEADSVFLRGGRVRLHFHVGIDPGSAWADSAAVEQALRAATRPWADAFAAAAQADGHPVSHYGHAFPVSYTERVDAAAAVADARILASLTPDSPPLLTLSAGGEHDSGLWLKLFGIGEEASLAEVLPILENFGLAVRSQRPYHVRAPDGSQQWIHEFEASHDQAQFLTDRDRAGYLADAYALVSSGQAENDGLNKLVVAAGLNPREIVLVRSIARYLMQTSLPFSARYLESLLATQAHIVAMAVSLFAQRFDPDREADEQQRAVLVRDIEQALDDIISLDADRALRSFVDVVQATLRTNYYQPDADGAAKPYVSIKLDPARIPEVPQPVPAFETFVYAPEVEGVHLRGGLVARGGIRWSDRQADFRTEVLGLMKAQMVKNAVIVPVGAKGGFVLKNVAASDDRETLRTRGIAGYQTFLRGLLDITDNRTPDGVVHPERVVRQDGDDPYLVVAADKGTAGFSDIANALSREYDYWLDDAFASGGSAGYDHKAMGITARGAWESVKRHFREMGHDIQSEPFTVVGIGDMGGDVFGNGMLLSEQIRLLAAFNHKHIFIDPDPDSATGFAERRRLFEMGASAWSDYDTSLLSAGGAIYERSAKRVELADEAMQALAIDSRRMTPDALIHELLRAPADLLWNGGIGTYVKAHDQSHIEVGDRANDSVRIDGRDLRCRVIGEGGNLGMTQAGRIEYALNGGRLNIDAIDNSGGVDSSDLEVNIKIALGGAEANGELDRTKRDELLHQMTDEVIALVLRTNYLQTQQLGLLARDSVARFDEHAEFMRTLEREGYLSRELDGLADEETIVERKRNRQGLTRPELAVLLSHAKVALGEAVLQSDLPDDAYLESTLFNGFPQRMCEAFPEAIRHHRLGRELIATRITNQMVNRLGVAMAHRLAADYGVDLSVAVRGYVLADAWLGAETLYGEIEALDNQVSTETQYHLFKRVSALVKHAINWYLSAAPDVPAIADVVQRYREPTQRLMANLPEYTRGAYWQRWQASRDKTIDAGVGQQLAERLASADVGGGLLDIVALGEDRDTDVAQVARIYFGLGDVLDLSWLHQAIQALDVDGLWPALARSNLRGDCYRVHQWLAALVLDAGGDLEAWHRDNAADVDALRSRIDELQSVEKPTFAHLSVAVRELSQLHDRCTRRATAPDRGRPNLR